MFSTQTVGSQTRVRTTSSVFTSDQHQLSQGFPGVAELTELPRFNINHQAELLTTTSPGRSHGGRLEQQEELQEELQQLEQQEELQEEKQVEEEEEEEEDIVSSEAFRNCSIKTL